MICLCLLVVCGHLLVVCGGLWSFAGGLWSFVVVASVSNYGFNEKSWAYYFHMNFHFCISVSLNSGLANLKRFTTACILKFSGFCNHTSSSLCYQVPKLWNFVFSSIFNERTSKVTDVSSYENIVRIISKCFNIILMRIKK